jgi:peptidoglycan/xylan/chitin deacetylase (PgdA/CDA1 family)
VEQATRPLLAMLADLGVPATWFSTGEVAERYPDAVRAVVAAGHELGCHGHTHRRFDAMGPPTRATRSSGRAWCCAGSRRSTPFRAPNLAFPDAYLPLLERAGYAVDSSHAKYKRPYWRDRRRPAPTRPRAPRGVGDVERAAAAAPVRAAYLAALASPVVLFVTLGVRRPHARAAPLDCRFNTGPVAFARVRAVLEATAARARAS